MISSSPTANGLFLQWNGVIDQFDDSGFDPLGHQWTWEGDTWRMEETWQGDDWVTDFHMDFSGLQQPGNQVFGADVIVDKQGQDVSWNCETDGPSFSCHAVNAITDRLNPGDEFRISAAFNTEQNPSITFNAEWTMDVPDGLFLQWNGVIDQFDDSGFDPLGHQWTWEGDTWRMEETWQGEGWVTDFHMDFSGLQQPGNQVFGADVIVDLQQGLDASWDCQKDGPSFSCFARDPIADRINPGQEFRISAAFNTEQNPSITFNAEWTMDENQCDFLPSPAPACVSDNDQVLNGDIVQLPNNPDTWESANLLSQPIRFGTFDRGIEQDFVFENGKHIKMSDETNSDEFLIIHIIGEVTSPEANLSLEIALTDEFGNIIPGTGPTPGLAVDGIVRGPFERQDTFFRDIINQGETLIFHDVFVNIKSERFTRIDHLSVGVQAETLNLGTWTTVPTGTNVMVQTPIPDNGIDSINLDFNQVTQEGNLSIDLLEVCPPLPPDFKITIFRGLPSCFDMTTDATFNGNVIIMIQYDDTRLTLFQQQSLRLFQFNEMTGMYDDITDSVDTDQNIITGTSSGFSIFTALAPAIVGGEEHPPDTTALLLAGTQMNAAWMIPVIISGIGIAIVIARKF